MSNGLGLYVSKRIMNCLGGTLEVMSSLGVKTVFKINFEALKIRGDPSVSYWILTFVAACGLEVQIWKSEQPKSQSIETNGEKHNLCQFRCYSWANKRTRIFISWKLNWRYTWRSKLIFSFLCLNNFSDSGQAQNRSTWHNSSRGSTCQSRSTEKLTYWTWCGK